jgi:Rrf2 family iron-sulfur cluster assembly transcriptional regulator
MRLTRAGEYGIRCVLYMATKGQGKIVNRREIALEMDIPDQFLSKIAQQLARAGIIEIQQGPKGGLRLLKSPVNISLLEVIEAVIGEIFLNDCILNPNVCGRSDTCKVHSVWEKARNQLRNTLQNADIASLVKD